MLQQPLSPLNRIAYPTDPNGLEGQPTTMLTALCQSQGLEIQISMGNFLAHASDGEVQFQAKQILLNFLTHVPSGLIGCALAA